MLLSSAVTHARGAAGIIHEGGAPVATVGRSLRMSTVYVFFMGIKDRPSHRQAAVDCPLTAVGSPPTGFTAHSYTNIFELEENQ